MRATLWQRGAAAALLFGLSAAAWAGGGVSVRFDLSRPDGAPFPSDRYTVHDGGNLTLRRVHLPKPDCALRPSDCADIDVLNTLDGFSTQPRITVPFDGHIDPSTVNSESVFLLCLGDVWSFQGLGERVGIDQAVWDPATRTLAFESDQLLRQHARYLLVVTDRVRDVHGQPLQPARQMRALLAQAQGHARELRDALQSRLLGVGVRPVAATLFTTQSISADLVKIGHQLRAQTPAPIDFMIGSAAGGGAPVRAVFPVAGTTIQFNRQTGAAPAFTPVPLPVSALQVVPGAVARVAYGRFGSPDYQTAAKYIPATPTLTGLPQPQGHNTLVVQVFVPNTPKPAAGWPVAIFGHGFTDSMYGAPWTVASVFAAHGIATVSINVVGHGGGAQGTLAVKPAGQAVVTVPAGGRGIDQDGNGSIDSTEGVNAAPPRTLLGNRDGLRQTVVDLMQLVRQIQVGVDLEGDGNVDLDAQRIYYAGQSFGGIYGTIFLGVEPALRAGVPNVPGGSITEVARLGAFRPLTGISLATRTPSLINVAHPSGIAFNENIPLRGEPARVNSVTGAMAIQAVLDAHEWAQQAGNPVSYAPFIRRQPLPGQAAKPVLLQFARGDVTVPNPTTSAIVRAGALQDRAVLFRNDLAHAANPALPKNAHTFLTNIGLPAAAPIAVGAQTQIAVFFASHGGTVIDPDGPGSLFEVPAASLPEDLGFLP
ncbi:MAG: hypothetical protein AB1430_12700 [Pseudomonadota bacterium]